MKLSTLRDHHRAQPDPESLDPPPLTDVVGDAQQYLAVLGSRSRDTVYLDTIETVLAQRPELVHYRVLFGPPRHQVLKDHLLRLLTIRDPHDRSLGVKTLHIGIVDDDPGAPERFFCASESAAVMPLSRR